MNIPTRADAIALGIDPAVWDTAMAGGGEVPPRVRAVETEATAERVEPGTVIARFTVEARPRPWRVSIRRRGPATNPKFAAWQRTVRAAASVAMAGRPPYAGLFAFHATFKVRRHGPAADGSNLSKGTLDALQGIVVINDRECRREAIEYDPDSDRDEATIEVMAL